MKSRKKNAANDLLHISLLVLCAATGFSCEKNQTIPSHLSGNNFELHFSDFSITITRSKKIEGREVNEGASVIVWIRPPDAKEYDLLLTQGFDSAEVTSRGPGPDKDSSQTAAYGDLAVAASILNHLLGLEASRLDAIRGDDSSMRNDYIMFIDNLGWFEGNFVARVRNILE